MRAGPVKFHGSKRFSVSIQQTEMGKNQIFMTVMCVT